MSSYLRPVPEPVTSEEPIGLAQDPDLTPAFSDDLRGVVQALRRHLWRFVGVFALVLFLTALFLYVAVPNYKGNATVVIDPRKQVVTNSPEVLADVPSDSSVIDTQVQLLQSRAVVGKAVDTLLAGKPALRARYPRYFVWQNHPMLPLPASSDDPAAARSDLIDLVLSELDVERIGLSSALTISYKDESPAQAALITNAVANAYIDYQADLKQAATKDANGWLKQRVAELKGQFEAAEAAVDAYRSRSGLLQAKGATSTENQLANLDLGLTEARQALGDAQSKQAAFRNALQKSGPAEAAKVVSTPTMQQLRAQYLSLVDQREQLSPTLGPNWPQMVELNKQIDGLQDQMNAEAQRTLGELGNEVAVAQNKVNSLLAINNDSRRQLATDNAASVKLAQLQSNADTLHQMYGDMLTRMQQVSAQENRGQVNATVVSEATLPGEPSFPKLKIVIAAAIGVGVALGALAVLLAQVFDGVLLRPKDLERRARVPVLALVPKLGSHDLRVGRKSVPMAEIIFDKPMSLFAESFRNLRVAMQDSVGTHQCPVVQITSGSFGEGKTICALAFAQAAAMDGQRVLLIDADIRRRSLTRSLGITTETGLIEFLRGKARLRDVLRAGGDKHKQPHILPLSTAATVPHDSFSSESFKTLLDTLKRAFDLIVIDSAPVLAVADSIALSRRADAVVLVTRWATTPLEIVLKAIEEIHRVGGRVAGILLTQVNVKKVTDQQFGRGYYPAMLKYYRQ